MSVVKSMMEDFKAKLGRHPTTVITQLSEPVNKLSRIAADLHVDNHSHSTTVDSCDTEQ